LLPNGCLGGGGQRGYPEHVNHQPESLDGFLHDGKGLPDFRSIYNELFSAAEK
jgi:hypothetical protein